MAVEQMCRGKVEMSPSWQSRNVACIGFQKLPFPHVREVGSLACGGFRQDRAPCLRAPQGSLDGFRSKQNNRPRREWGFRISNKGTFLSRRKGDIFIEARHSPNPNCQASLEMSPSLPR